MVWTLLILSIILSWFFIWAVFKAGADADRRSEEEFYRKREWNDDVP